MLLKLNYINFEGAPVHEDDDRLSIIVESLSKARTSRAYIEFTRKAPNPTNGTTVIC